MVNVEKFTGLKEEFGNYGKILRTLLSHVGGSTSKGKDPYLIESLRIVKKLITIERNLANAHAMKPKKKKTSKKKIQNISETDNMEIQ